MTDILAVTFWLLYSVGHYKASTRHGWKKDISDCERRVAIIRVFLKSLAWPYYVATGLATPKKITTMWDHL
jgi:hypothetical protein